VGTREGQAGAKAVVGDGSVGEVRRPGDRRRLETAVVLAVNDANVVWPLGWAIGKPKCVGPGDSMAARRKLKEIDGRAPQKVERAA